MLISKNIKIILFLFMLFCLIFQNINAQESNSKNSEEFIEYKVKMGDTLSKILLTLNYKPIYGKLGYLDKTVKLNSDKFKFNADNIYIDEIIKLPINNKVTKTEKQNKSIETNSVKKNNQPNKKPTEKKNTENSEKNIPKNPIKEEIKVQDDYDEEEIEEFESTENLSIPDDPFSQYNQKSINKNNFLKDQNFLQKYYGTPLSLSANPIQFEHKTIDTNENFTQKIFKDDNYNCLLEKQSNRDMLFTAKKSCKLDPFN